MGIRTPCYTTIKEQYHINHMSIRTPCYSTIKEPNYVGKMDIRTPSNTTIKQQIILVIWVSEHHAILQ